MMNEMSTSSVRQFGPGFSTGRGFLPRTAREPPFGHNGPPSHFYGPPSNFQGSRQPGNYQCPPVPSDNYQEPHVSGNYQGHPPFPPSNYREPPLRGSMRGYPEFHSMRGPRGYPYGYNEYPPMYGPPFDPNFMPHRRPAMGTPMRRRYKGRRGKNSKPETWKREPKEVKEPPVNEWERRENWWNDAIQKAVKEKKVARKRWKATRSSEDWKLYLQSKKEAKRKVAQAKAKAFLTMCPGEVMPRRKEKKVSNKPNDLNSTAEDNSQTKDSEDNSQAKDSEDNSQAKDSEDNSQAKDSEEISATEDQGNVSSSSEDQNSATGDVPPGELSEDISTVEEQENVSGLCEHYDNTTVNAS